MASFAGYYADGCQLGNLPCCLSSVYWDAKMIIVEIVWLVSALFIFYHFTVYVVTRKKVGFDDLIILFGMTATPLALLFAILMYILNTRHEE